MTYKHVPLEGFTKHLPEPIKYVITSQCYDIDTYEMEGHILNEHDTNAIFYTVFKDSESTCDLESCMLMCSEVELKELVNHLRMIRGV